MAIETRLTKSFDIRHPIILAPMDPASGGALAAAVSAGGGLGLIGGGYGGRERLEGEFTLAGNQRVGCGFITWSMAQDPSLLDLALARRPAAMMLSFADPGPFAASVHAAGIPLICQVHTLEHARLALAAGADVLVAQGTEAGGHGLQIRSTFAFLPAVADLLSRTSPSTMLVAAGGIADGRGLVAALALGADGILMGTRFWATQEALIHPAAKQKILQADGDETIRTSVYDIVRNKRWPSGYTGRLMRNDFIEEWHGREKQLEEEQPERLAAFEAAHDTGDYEVANVTVGEAIGLIDDLPAAADLVERIARDAETRIAAIASLVAV